MTKKIIISLLKEKKYSALKHILAVLNEVDLAELIEALEERERIMVFRLLEKKKAGEAFAYMNAKTQQLLIGAFTEKELKEIIEEMFLDDTMDLLEEMPANVIERILSIADETTRANINMLLHYPKDSVGSVMTVEYVELKKEMSVTEAIGRIKDVGIDKETIYTCYVIERRKLIGIVSVKDLLISKGHIKIERIMETNIISIATNQDQEEAVKLLKRYKFMAVPVLDQEACMVGIVTYDDVMQVFQEEVNEDLAMMSAILPNEASYFETSVLGHARSRIAWLFVLMLSATITGSIITKYETAFSALPLLVSFIPMLMDTGGNCGAQSSTLIIRGIAMDEITSKEFLKVIWKEFRVALVVSIVLSLVNAIRIFVMYQDLTLAIIVGASLIATVIISKLIGCLLPMLATKCKFDPALMSAPLITTIVDTCSVFIYFNIATRIFQ